MPGIDMKGDGVKLFIAIIKEDQTPQLVEVFSSVEGSSAISSNSTSLPNRKTMIRSVKQEILDYITSIGAVYDESVVIPD
jgi:hypothetical protein